MGVRNVSFPENFAYVLNEWSPTWTPLSSVFRRIANHRQFAFSFTYLGNFPVSWSERRFFKTFKINIGKCFERHFQVFSRTFLWNLAIYWFEAPALTACCSLIYVMKTKFCVSLCFLSWGASLRTFLICNI